MEAAQQLRKEIIAKLVDICDGERFGKSLHLTKHFLAFRQCAERLVCVAGELHAEGGETHTATLLFEERSSQLFLQFLHGIAEVWLRGVKFSGSFRIVKRPAHHAKVFQLKQCHSEGSLLSVSCVDEACVQLPGGIADARTVKDILQEYPEKARKTEKMGEIYKEIFMNPIRKDKMDETEETR